MNVCLQTWFGHAFSARSGLSLRGAASGIRLAMGAAVVGLVQVATLQPANATRYFYEIGAGQAFLGVVYENDRAYGGGGRSKFQVDFASQTMVLIADDVANTLTISGLASGSYNAAGSDPSNLGNIPQLIPGTYQVQANYVNAQISDPTASRNPVIVSGAGSGDGFFQKNGQQWYSSNDGRQYFWDMDFNGTPPPPNVQLSNYSFGLESLGNDLFKFDGWIHSGMVAGLLPFYHGDFHGTARYVGSDAPPAPPTDVPEPGTVALLLTGLAGLRARYKKSAS